MKVPIFKCKENGQFENPQQRSKLIQVKELSFHLEGRKFLKQ